MVGGACQPVLEAASFCLASSHKMSSVPHQCLKPWRSPPDQVDHDPLHTVGHAHFDHHGSSRDHEPMPTLTGSVARGLRLARAACTQSLSDVGVGTPSAGVGHGVPDSFQLIV